MNHSTLVRPALYFCIIALLGGCQAATGIYDVRAFGAKGDGRHLDTPAVNRAIDAAARAGGGTVRFSAGTYLCYSVHLQSNITLYLDSGATIRAAGTKDKGQFDAPEFNPSDHYQDFGHTHWHNSLIWGENIQNVAIVGPGRIDGQEALRATGKPTTKPATKPSTKPTTTSGPSTTASTLPATEPWFELPAEEWPDEDQTSQAHPVAPWRVAFLPTTRPSSSPSPAETRPSPDIPTQDYFAEIAMTQPSSEPSTAPATHPDYPNEEDTIPSGIGDKAIALKNCHNVLLRDISIFQGGHFAILATAVDGLTIDNVKIDTNRDGMDIDSCRNVRVSNCSVNSPWDDGICLKSSFGLGYARDTENVTIANCLIAGGYEKGALLDGSFRHIGPGYAKDSHVPRTGRIKLGTESNGGFKNIAISNCLFDDCQGLAIESVDGGVIENVTVSNLAMRDITSAPIFIRLGSRLRGPPDQPIGAIRHINISDVVSESAAVDYACIISGIPGHPIEDVRIHNTRLEYPGGGTRRWLTWRPTEDINSYPDPTMFGGMPAYGFFIRHVTGLNLSDVELSCQRGDVRPPFILVDVHDAYFQDVTAPHVPHTPMFLLRQVTDFTTRQVKGLSDMHRDSVANENF